MDIDSIPQSNFSDVELKHLRVFQTLLREHNLTRAAEVLDVTQPALSKTLRKLRSYFGDPLFIRVGHRMEPTAKSLELAPLVADVLDRITTLRTEQVPFDPATSSRAFSFCVVDAGIIRLLPPLIELIERQAPGIQLNVLPLDLERLETSLESGKLDFAMGSYPSLSKRIRRQSLWSVNYLSSVRKAHPRIKGKPTLAAFAAEKHVLVSATGTGHAHARAEKALENAVPAQNIVCRVPTFLTAAFVASRSNAIVTLPEAVGRLMASQLGMRVFAPPLRLPRIDVSQYWHERFHRDPGNRWIRNVFASLFREE
jgi:DNA-binding transcriptional LysR family regulator